MWCASQSAMLSLPLSWAACYCWVHANPGLSFFELSKNSIPKIWLWPLSSNMGLWVGWVEFFPCSLCLGVLFFRFWRRNICCLLTHLKKSCEVCLAYLAWFEFSTEFGVIASICDSVTLFMFPSCNWAVVNIENIAKKNKSDCVCNVQLCCLTWAFLKWSNSLSFFF